MTDAVVRKGRSLKPAAWIVGAVLLAFLALGVFRVGGKPEVRIQPALPVIGQRTPVTIEIAEPRRGLSLVRVELVQGDRSAPLFEKTYAPAAQIPFLGSGTGRDTIRVEAGRRNFPALTGGDATLRVTSARPGTWLRHPAPQVEERPLPVRLTPPSLEIRSSQTYVNQGGCEAVVYSVGESAVRDGVRAGSWWFPGFPLPGGGARDRFALFAVPYDMDRPEVRLVAEDAAGNAAETGFIDQFFPRPVQSDTIQVSDPFLAKVVPAIVSRTPEFRERGTLLESYLAINREMRDANQKTILALARKSTPGFLWRDAFVMMPNSKKTASFAQRRSYLYQGREVDVQTHLGYDLAAVKQAPVPAANSGVVLFAGFLGIYGNAVVIDHGYGLQSIYAHLSSMGAKEGQKVARGDIIGRTGETGLAGGDHLHFSVILQGLPVDSIEWCDGHWIADRIARKLGAALTAVQ